MNAIMSGHDPAPLTDLPWRVCRRVSCPRAPHPLQRRLTWTTGLNAHNDRTGMAC